MAANPYEITPASPMAGFGALLQGIGSRAERLKAEKQEKERMATLQKAGRLIQRNDINALSQLSMENPWLSKHVETNLNIKNEATKQNMIQSALRIARGEDPVRVLSERAEMVIGEGGDASDTLGLLQQALSEPGYTYRYDPQSKQLFRNDNWGFDQSGGEVSIGPRMISPGVTDPDDIRPLQERVTQVAPTVKEELDWKQEYEKGLAALRGEGPAASPMRAEAQVVLAMLDPNYKQYKDVLFPETPEEAKTTEIKEFEYAEKHPKYAAAQKAKADDARTAELKKQKFTDTSKLRKEFLDQSKEYQKVRDSYTRIEGVAKDPSPAGDLALIFNYMKMLDPGSTVRESEFATAANSAGVPERIRVMWNKALEGERLTPKMRKDFLGKASVLFKGMEDQHKKRERNYRFLARKNNLPVDEVVVDITAPEPAPPEKVEQLRQNPDAMFTDPDTGRTQTMRDWFLEKYGHIPEGI